MNKRIEIVHYSLEGWQVRIEDNLYSKVSNASISRLSDIFSRNYNNISIKWVNFFEPAYFSIIFELI